MDLLKYNREAWDRQAENGDRWSVPVDSERVARARTGDWQVVLTPTKPVPRAWFPAEFKGCKLLGLASGGGQQGPLFAAAGAVVSILDNSPGQLALDGEVAKREGLEINLVQGDMADLNQFEDGSVDVVFNPCSNCFAPDLAPVWRECFRVLRPGGVLMTGICNPIMFSFDPELEDKGIFQLKYPIPYSDLTSLNDTERQCHLDKNEPMSFGHSLTQQMGGLIQLGFVVDGFYEDSWGGDDRVEAYQGMDKYFEPFIALRARKP